MQYKKQNGVALVVGLVMLMVLTILGVSSMSGTTLELKIARNTQGYTNAYWTTYTAIKCALRGDCAVDFTDIDNIQTTTYTSPDGTLTAVIEVESIGCTRVEGGSLNKAASMNVFEFDAVGESADGFAKSRQIMGVGVLNAKKCENS